MTFSTSIIPSQLTSEYSTQTSRALSCPDKWLDPSINVRFFVCIVYTFVRESSRNCERTLYFDLYDHFGRDAITTFEKSPFIRYSMC